MEPDGIIESNWSEIIDNFDDMNLKEELLRGIYGYGFERPSAIQQRAIMPCVRGRDVIAQAQSGKKILFRYYFHNIFFRIFVHFEQHFNAMNTQNMYFRNGEDSYILDCNSSTNRHIHS